MRSAFIGVYPRPDFMKLSFTDALDLAAVSAISAAQTFPQFPTGFTGDQVRLRLMR
jgi:hypothetical protein